MKNDTSKKKSKVKAAVADSLEDLLVQYEAARRASKRAATHESELKKALTAEMQAADISTLDAKTDDGETIKATYVSPERVIVDEDRLRELLPNDVWEKVTKRVLDNQKLEAAITMDLVDVDVVTEASTLKASTPYLRVSLSKED